MKRLDIIGVRYGRLTVVKEIEPKGRIRRFLCRCDCGNEKIASMNLLRSGRTKSCGCLHREKTSLANLKDLTGQHFGRLTVIERSKKIDVRKRVYWTCRCECGNTVDILSSNLVRGLSTSCGCLRIESGIKVKQHQDKTYRINDILIPSLKRHRYKNNSSGVKGVSVVQKKNERRYKAEISIGKKKIYLGTFRSLEEAAAARKRGEEMYHKPYLETQTE